MARVCPGFRGVGASFVRAWGIGRWGVSVRGSRRLPTPSPAPWGTPCVCVAERARSRQPARSRSRQPQRSTWQADQRGLVRSLGWGERLATECRENGGKLTHQPTRQPTLHYLASPACTIMPVSTGVTLTRVTVVSQVARLHPLFGVFGLLCYTGSAILGCTSCVG